MIGLIQRVLIDHVELHHGKAAVERIAAKAGVRSLARRIDTDYDDACRFDMTFTEASLT